MHNMMIITQKVDTNDPVLGFFHRWIEEFAKHAERVEVLCLFLGAHALPPNVFVRSLGKEKGYSKLRQLARFWKYCARLTPQIDGVFVHMNAVYVPLGWLFWKLHRKKIILWRNHPQGGVLARIAYALADRILYTSPFAHAARHPRSQRMPAGIDTEFFRCDQRVVRKPNSILCLGRISPIKHLETVIEAARLLLKKNTSFTLSVIGSPTNPEDYAYEKNLRKNAWELVERGNVVFSPGVPQQEVPRLYNSHEIFVNATPVGSYDKTVLEATACETLTTTSNVSFSDVVPKERLFTQGDSQSLADNIDAMLQISAEEKKRLAGEYRRRVIERHGLAELARLIFSMR